MMRHGPYTKFLVLLVGLALHSVGIAQNEKPITDRILYTVRLDDPSGRDEGNYAHLAESRRREIVNDLCSLALIGSIEPIKYWGDRVHSLPSRFDSENRFMVSDTAWNDPPTNQNSKRSADPERNNLFYPDLVNSLSFLEEWYFDELSNSFRKQVQGVVLFQDKYTHGVGMRRNYYLPLEGGVNIYDPDHLVASDIVYDVRISDPHAHSCDDTNWWSEHLEASARERFLDLLTFKALIDTITPIQVRSPVFPYDSVFARSPFVNRGMNVLYYGRSNWINSDPLMFGMTDEKIMACCYELAAWQTVTKIRFHESWYFDPDRLHFEKKVMDIGLIVNRYNDQGIVIGDTCLVMYHLAE